MKKNIIIVLVITLCVSFTLAGYGQSVEAIDYSQIEHWLALPSSIEEEVDVFYLYPTAWEKVDPNEPNICAVDNPSLLEGSKEALEKQATAFETVANIYAPYYRQADIVYTLSLPIEEQCAVIGGIPKADALAAFEYYIKNYNNDRPFILAGHSQGSNILVYLLSEYMKENPKVYARMVAAYVIGYSITEDYLAKNPHLKFAEGPDDTGVIISYNTEAPGVQGNNPVLLPGVLAINPISWTIEETLATAQDSLGSIMSNAEGEFEHVENYADAQVNKARGVVICSTADVEKLSPGDEVFIKGVYHRFDYSFYYYNLRENAKNRTKIFINKP